MPGLSATVFESDFNAIRGDWPQTLTIKGQDYAAVVHDVDNGGDTLMDAGVMPQYSIEAQVLRSEFASIPDVGTKATFNGLEYRIVRVRDSACGLVRTIYLEDLTA